MPIPRVLIALTALLLGAAAQAGATLDERDEVRRFIAEVVARHDYPAEELQALFAQAQIQPSIIEAISRPAESKPWHAYRPIFLTDSRIEQGVAFWDEHSALLDRASAAYGVPPEIIVAILGVETRYGRHAGSYRVLDALATLAFEYPPRAEFFRKELEHYLLLTREERVDPLALKGSYAGAMGQAQFIPSSYRHYAVDFDGDGVRDLVSSTADAIGSIANYFKVHDWRAGEPVASRARIDGERFRPLLERGVKPHLRVAELADYGITPLDALAPEQGAALFELETEQGPEYWVGLQNFYVITRYNRSNLYAMAVYQLSQAIREQRLAHHASLR